MKISIHFFTAILSLVIISCVPDKKSEEKVDNSKPKRWFIRQKAL